MPPSLVYLIPEDYFGPIFIFFNQPDGVDLQSDPLGRAVWVPENGVIKARFSTKDIPFGTASPTYRPEYFVSVSKTGQRRILTVNSGDFRDEDGSLTTAYLNGQNQIHQYKYSDDLKSNQSEPFYYFSEAQRNERMIFNRDGCSHQGFSPNASKALGRTKEMSNEEAGIPACNKFLIASPNEFLNLPSWMWENVGRRYRSIQEFVDEANERVKKKKEYYKLP